VSAIAVGDRRARVSKEARLVVSIRRSALARRSKCEGEMLLGARHATKRRAALVDGGAMLVLFVS
jgi:hypothetical protein